MKLVQYIKLPQQECGLGSEMVRAPRLPLVGEERERILAIIRQRHRDPSEAQGRIERADDRRCESDRSASARIEVIDTHTGGEPTRVVIAGGPDLGAGTMAERLAVFRDRHDAVSLGRGQRAARLGRDGRAP